MPHHQPRSMRVLVADPRMADYEPILCDRVELEFCDTGRAALRHADEALDYVLLSTSLADLEFQDVAEMFQANSHHIGLIVVSENTNAAEESLARQLGAVLYRQHSPQLDWLADLIPRRVATGAASRPAARLTLDWHPRPPRRVAAC